MDDPFSALQNSLLSVFKTETKRNGKYTNHAIQDLENAIEHYNPKTKNSFIRLLQAIREAMPSIEKRPIYFDAIKKSMDDLAANHQINIDWNIMLSHTKVSPKFQFSALNHAKKDDDFLNWLARKNKQLQPFDQITALINCCENPGFNQKLEAHIKKHPKYLSELIKKSLENFEKIANTVIILHVTDLQIALAIKEHFSGPTDKNKVSFEEVEQVINTLNTKILSHGRSVSTVLRSADAAPVLMESTFIEIAQSEEYKKRHAEPQAPSFS